MLANNATHHTAARHSTAGSVPNNQEKEQDATTCSDPKILLIEFTK
jgi:hypothetical protein